MTQGYRPVDFSGQWLLLGVSTHHWQSSPRYRFPALWKNPSLMKNGYVWDVDNGTDRLWAGSYRGRLPRVTGAYKGPLE